MAIILGVDPGSRKTGFGIIESRSGLCSHIHSGTIVLKAKDSMAYRLHIIYETLYGLIETYTPHAVAIEKAFVYKNPNSALVLGQARGAAIVAVGAAGLALTEYTARAVKLSVVGFGGADKIQVQHMVKTILKIKETLQSDEADALAIALTHAHTQSRLNLLAKQQGVHP